MWKTDSAVEGEQTNKCLYNNVRGLNDKLGEIRVSKKLEGEDSGLVEARNSHYGPNREPGISGKSPLVILMIAFTCHSVPIQHRSSS